MTSPSHPTLQSLGDALDPAIRAQFETFCRGLIQGPGVEADARAFRLVTHEAHPLGNFSIVSAPCDREGTEAAMGPLLDLAFPTAAIFPEAPTPGAVAFLTERGYALAESLPAMAVDLDALARPVLADGVTFAEVDWDTQREAWNEALAVGYELPRGVADRFGPERLPTSAGQYRYFAAFVEGRMVATSTLFLEGGLAGIYCVSTRPEYRGRGLGAFLTAEPLHRVRADGYRVGLLQSSAMGEPVYRRLGFAEFGVMPLYVRMP